MKIFSAIIAIGLLMTVLCSIAFAHHYICEFFRVKKSEWEIS